jgi:hypothetical protein
VLQLLGPPEPMGNQAEAQPKTAAPPAPATAMVGDTQQNATAQSLDPPANAANRMSPVVTTPGAARQERAAPRRRKVADPVQIVIRRLKRQQRLARDQGYSLPEEPVAPERGSRQPGDNEQNLVSAPALWMPRPTNEDPRLASQLGPSLLPQQPWMYPPSSRNDVR